MFAASRLSRPLTQNVLRLVSAMNAKRLLVWKEMIHFVGTMNTYCSFGSAKDPNSEGGVKNSTSSIMMLPVDMGIFWWNKRTVLDSFIPTVLTFSDFRMY
jgi:hypothetical protein